MRKVKVTPAPGSAGKKVYLFPNSGALALWMRAIEAGEHVQVPNIVELVLDADSFIEAEMMGFEYSYEEEGRPPRRLDLVRLGLAQQPKNAAGLSVSIHTGWVSGGLLPLREHQDAGMCVAPLSPQDAKIDLALLFRDAETA